MSIIVLSFSGFVNTRRSYFPVFRQKSGILRSGCLRRSIVKVGNAAGLPVHLTLYAYIVAVEQLRRHIGAAAEELDTD